MLVSVDSATVALRMAALLRPDFVYTPKDGKSGQCFYRHQTGAGESVPGCIVGFVADAHGHTDLAEGLAATGCGIPTANTEALLLLTDVQLRQDNRESWGFAVGSEVALDERIPVTIETAVVALRMVALLAGDNVYTNPTNPGDCSYWHREDGADVPGCIVGFVLAAHGYKPEDVEPGSADMVLPSMGIEDAEVIHVLHTAQRAQDDCRTPWREAVMVATDGFFE